MITVYTGDGKGKTTSALGEALLSLAPDKKILMIQFLKGSTYSGELTGLYRLGIPLIQFGVGCRWAGMIRSGLKHCTNCGECFQVNRDPEVAIELVQEALNYISQVLQEKKYQVIILDEISHALNHGFLDLQILLGLIKNSYPHWILTGRRMPQEIHECADSWWELKTHKHPYQQGVPSRRGIEY
ncbi:cob(I)yrinic acid a,c-diamide adenosyltransferase [Desulfosporosinus burensis]